MYFCFVFFFLTFLSTVFIPKPKVSQPGELRREYEEEVNKVRETVNSIFLALRIWSVKTSITYLRNISPGCAVKQK